MAGKRGGKKKKANRQSTPGEAVLEQVTHIFERALALTHRLAAAEKELRAALSKIPGPTVRRAPARRSTATKAAPARARRTAAKKPAVTPRAATPRATRRPRTPRGTPGSGSAS